MDEKVIEKLKETSIAEKILEVNNTQGVKAVFENAGVKISTEDAKDIFEGKENLFSQVASMSEEELQKYAGGYRRYQWINEDNIEGFDNRFCPEMGLIANLSVNAGVAAARLARENVGISGKSSNTMGIIASYTAEGLICVGLLGAGATLAATTLGAAVGIKKVVSAVKRRIKNRHSI